MKKFFKDVVKNECGENIFFNYSVGEYDETIEARRYISMSDKINLSKFIWDVYYDKDVDVFNFTFLEPTIRMMIVKYYCISPNLGTESNVSKLYPFLMCTSFYKELCGRVPDIAETLKCIHKTIEDNTYRVKNKKGIIEDTISSVLAKLDAIIPQDFDMNDALNTYKEIVGMNNDKELVDKILNYHKNSEAGSDESNDKQGV